jgi:IS30 family transposase
MPKKTAEETSAAIINRLQSLPFYARQTLTRDNGTENAKHKDLSKSLEPNATSHIHTQESVWGLKPPLEAACSFVAFAY